MFTEPISKMTRKFVNHITDLEAPSGKVFGAWVVQDAPPQRLRTRLQWLCRCECGTERYVRADRLRAGKSSSCGCLVREFAKSERGNTTHGLSHTPEYRAWRQARSRCVNPVDENWAKCGGIGIEMCQEWIDDFLVFLDDVGNRPGPGYSLIRIDVKGDFEPNNVEWRMARRGRKGPRDINSAENSQSGFWYRGEWRTK